MRPRKSRIFYNGKFLDYPLRPREHAQGGRSDRGRAVRALLPLGPHPAAEGPDQLRGLAGRPVRLAPLPDVLQDLHREGVGRAGLVDAGRLGRAAGQGARPRQGDRQHAPAEAEPEGHHLPHRGVPVPQARARDDVGGLPSTRSWRRARPCTCGPSVTRVRHEDGRAVEVEATAADGIGHPPPLRPRDLVDADQPSCSRRWTRRCPTTCCSRPRASRYRDFLSVALVVPEADVPWTDNWIYVHDPEVEVGRIQNFGSWSPYMVKDGRNVLGLEYFVFEGDRMWNSSDEELVELGKRELEALGLVDAKHVEAGYVVRQPKAYPFYDEHYRDNVDVLREWLAAQHPERAPGRPQRHVPVQQPGPLDVHRDAHRGEHLHRHPPRRLGGERRGGVPRDRRGRRSRGRRHRRPPDGPRWHRAGRAGRPPRRVRSRPGPAGVSAPTERSPRWFRVGPRSRSPRPGSSGASPTRSRPSANDTRAVQRGRRVLLQRSSPTTWRRATGSSCRSTAQPAADHPPLTVLVLGPTARLFDRQHPRPAADDGRDRHGRDRRHRPAGPGRRRSGGRPGRGRHSPRSTRTSG